MDDDNLRHSYSKQENGFLKPQTTKKMKTFTTITKAFYALIILALTTTTVKSQCSAPDLSFKNPTLYSGVAGQKNAKYKFPSVYPGVDAYISIVDIVGGAKLTNIDDVVNGYGDAWQPVVDRPSSPLNNMSYINWQIDFCTSVTVVPYTFYCFTLSAIDIDGDGSKIREFIEAQGPITYNTKLTTLLTVTTGADYVRGMGPVTTKTGIDTSAWDTNINFNYNNLSSVRVKTGAKVQATGGSSSDPRLNCIFFRKIGNPAAFSAITTPLPVKYTSFDATVKNTTVSLNWNTQMEVNSNHFEVERSFDSRNFSTLAMVLDAYSANGNNKSYKYKDNGAELAGKAVVYYRIKQVDADGKATYSTVLSVRLQSKSGVTMQVSPNPFMEKLTVRFESAAAGNAEVRIVNMTGQTIASKQTIIGEGYNNLQVEGLNKLSSGMYVAQVYVNGVIVDTQKVIRN